MESLLRSREMISAPHWRKVFFSLSWGFEWRSIFSLSFLAVHLAEEACWPSKSSSSLDLSCAPYSSGWRRSCVPYWQYILCSQRAFWPSWFYILFLCQPLASVKWRTQNLWRAFSSITSNNHSWLVAKFPRCTLLYNPDVPAHCKSPTLYQHCQLSLF